MLDSTFVKAIQDGSDTRVVSISGNEFSTRQVFNAPLPEEPRIQALTIATLRGFVNFCKEKAGTIADRLIHIESPVRVSLLSEIEGSHLKRQSFIIAQVPDKSFAFGVFMEHSDFMVQLQTMFEPNEGRAALLRIIGTVKDENVRTSLDSGITQRITASSGVTLAQDVPVPNPVELRPYRTFREIEQPASLFVVRLEQVPGDMPNIALFEADGGAWKIEAVSGIGIYLQEAIPEAVIVG